MPSVNIIGKGNGWQEAPLDGENWGITQLLLRRPVNMVIDMNVYHDGRWGQNEWDEAQRVRQLCEERGIVLYDTITYPLDIVKRAFNTDYFTNTVDYAIALAVYAGFTEIHLYGVNMATNSEYSYQKPGVDFWCGVAVGRGCKVIVHGEQSRILRSHDGLVYGYDTKQNYSPEGTVHGFSNNGG